DIPQAFVACSTLIKPPFGTAKLCVRALEEGTKCAASCPIGKAMRSATTSGRFPGASSCGMVQSSLQKMVTTNSMERLGAGHSRARAGNPITIERVLISTNEFPTLSRKFQNGLTGIVYLLRCRGLATLYETV